MQMVFLLDIGNRWELKISKQLLLNYLRNIVS